MSGELNELVSAKRRRRAAAKQKSPPLVQDENESGDPNERPTRDRHPNEFVNSAFVDDAEQDQANTSSQQVEEGRPKELPNLVATRHRDKSRELANALKQDDDPNQVSERIRGVQDRVRDKLRPLLQSQTVTSPTGGAPPDLRLDLTGATSNVNDLNASQSMLSTGLGTQRFNASDKAREAAEHRMRKIKESSYRTAALSGLARRDTTRFDDDDEAATAAEDKQADSLARFRFKKIGLAVIEGIHVPTDEEKVDFFSKQTWEEDRVVEPPPSAARKTEEEIQKAEEEAAKTTPGKEDEMKPFIMKLEDDDWRDIAYSKAVYIPHDLHKELEAKKMFRPKSINVPLNKKLGENVENPRFLESEGYYVGRKPYVTTKNRNLMENRLIEFDKSKKWFGVDGEIVALADPIRYVSTRPSLNPTYSLAIDAEYRKALYLSDFANNVNVHGGVAINNSNLVAPRHRLDLDINQIQFEYHRLFSVEHIMAYRLRAMCQHYKLSEEQNLIEILKEKLSALKKALITFKSEMDVRALRQATERNAYIESTQKVIKLNSEQDNEMITQVDLSRLRAYQNEIKLTREQRDIEMAMRKQLTEKILATWRMLKDLRVQQGFRNTEFKLIIKKKEVNKDKEIKQFERELKEEFDETLAELREEYERQIHEYNANLKAWKLQKTRKNEARKRQEEREKNKDKINTDMILAMKEKEVQENDTKILNEEDLIKPEKPQEINEEELYNSIRTRYLEKRKAPGDPILSFDLIEESGTITPTAQCKGSEQIRRNQLARTRLYVKIFMNNKLVHTTADAQLQSDFTVKWAQIYNIYVLSSTLETDSIVLEIFERSDPNRATDHVVAAICIPTPDPASTSYALDDYQFSAQSGGTYVRNLDTSQGNAAAGNNRQQQDDVIYTSGIIKAGARWAEVDTVRKDAQIAQAWRLREEKLNSNDPLLAVGVSHMQDIDKLARWVQRSNLDPNDPRNADLISLIKAISDGSWSGFRLPVHFRLDQLMQEFEFATDAQIQADRRFRLIELRAANEPEFRGFHMIPALERHVRRDQFELYERRRLKDALASADDDLDDEERQDDDDALGLGTGTTGPKSLTATSRAKFEQPNQIDLARIRGRKTIREVRERIIKQFRFVQSQKSLSDMVIEEQVPDINALGNLFWNLYVEPRRPLYPQRRERKKVKGQNIAPEDVLIIVNIVNAYDLPVREEKLGISPIKTIKDRITGKEIRVHENIAGESLVRPFVEVTFQETVYRTTTADGPNASWNQEIQLPFKAPNNDLRPESLQTCKDNIYINVFDEIVVDVLEDERERDTTVHKKKLRYYLGSIKIPFSTVYFRSKIEGTFKLDTPPVMIGYKKDPKMSHLNSYSILDSNVSMEKPIRDSSYLSLFVTIEPQLLVPEVYRESYDTIESIELLDKVVNWSSTFRKKYPNREFHPIVMNSDGKSVLITRYLRPIKPPAELIDRGKEDSFETALNVARFVSLIPFVSDSLIFPGICDIWSTCDQFMEMLAGDEEEHSVLLMNFFLGLGKKPMLLIGSSITNGLCSYVLTLENNEYTIWYQGQPYKVNEPHNPVKVVSALVTPDNMWFNTQQFDEPYRIKFDTSQTKNWRAFFDANNANRFESIQPEQLIYTETNERDRADLERKIDLEIRAKMRKWRGYRTFHASSSYITAKLRDLLHAMERYSVQMNASNDDAPIKRWLDELAQLQIANRVTGFPINLPYTNMKAILDAVHATQAHAIPTNDVDYAISVYVHAYPNSILSVWVYLAVLIKKDATI